MTALLPAGLVAAALLSGVLLWRRTTRRSERCPRCGTPVAERRNGTGDGSAAPVGRARKCPACRWRAQDPTVATWPGEGKRPTGGFFEWGEERFPQDFGFRWADTHATSPDDDPPPDDPSGFRWKDDRPAG